jgi:GSH-dependent disulfide-bond oxidoreductase
MNPSPILDRCVLDDLLDGSLDEKLERARSSVELYGAKTGNCLRASVALEEAEIPYIVRKLDLRRSEHRTPEHLSRNPLGKVPTLVERFRDGRALILSQSNAILMYAAEGSPPRLLPSDTSERALVLQRFFYFVTDVIAVSHAGFATKNNGGDQSFLDGQSLGALAFAESFLENSTFMAGEAFSLADIAAFTIASSYQSRLEWDRLPKMRRWFDQVSAMDPEQKWTKCCAAGIV